LSTSFNTRAKWWAKIGIDFLIYNNTVERTRPNLFAPHFPQAETEKNTHFPPKNWFLRSGNGGTVFICLGHLTAFIMQHDQSRRYTRGRNHQRGGDYQNNSGGNRRNNHDIYHRHYERNDDEYHDSRRDYDSGRPNHPNRGREVYAEGPNLNRGYGYNQGRNSTSNVGGRAYGQSYGQYYQGSDLREHSNPRDYQGDFDPYYRDYYDRSDDYFSDRYEDDRDDLRDEFRHSGFQGSGYNEGFGQRAGHRNERHWLDDDEYRGGHAQRHRGVGKYGSR
jgi:hypothetical protein